MPFDSNGNFSLVPGYLATTGETILASQHNPPLEDIASGLSQVMLRSGNSALTGNWNFNGFKGINLAAGTAETDAVNVAQMTAAISNATSGGVPTGAIMPFMSNSPPAGWIKGNGGTIGSPISGATLRANADTRALFSLLWSNFNNTDLPIQSSGGSATSRGSSADADFDAGKRMPVFDLRTRFVRGIDDGLGFSPDVKLGAIQQDALKAHTHEGETAISGEHDHSVPRSSSGGGGTPRGFQFGERTNNGQDKDPSATMGGSHKHALVITPTGDPLETRPRSFAALYCIKL